MLGQPVDDVQKRVVVPAAADDLQAERHAVGAGQRRDADGGRAAQEGLADSGAEMLRFMRQAVDDFGQTLVMVTHDPIAASYASRVVFLADGRIVDELAAPGADEILDHVKALAAV